MGENAFPTFIHWLENINNRLQELVELEKEKRDLMIERNKMLDKSINLQIEELTHRYEHDTLVKQLISEPALTLKEK